MSAGKSATPRLSYLSVKSYHQDIFAYAPALENYVETGSLVAASNANSNTCPKGRILRENGRKLYPGANPGITVYLVGVYDAISGVSGFIDPNSPVFTLYSTNKVYSIPSSTDPGPGGLFDQGMPILTNSSVEAGTFVQAHTNVIADIDVNAGRDVNATRNVQVGGRLIMNNGNSGTANMASGIIVGIFRKLTVNASRCVVGSIIMLTYAGQDRQGFLSAEAIANGSFQIVSSNTADSGNVMWLIVG